MNIFVKGKYGRNMITTPEELKEKFGISFDIVALGIEVGNDKTAVKAQSYPGWDYKSIDLCTEDNGNEMQAAMFQLPTPEIPAPFCRLYDEQGNDEEDWFAAASFSPRSDNDDSKHPVFVDDGFGKPVLASDVIQNRDGEFSSRCSTSKELFDFNVAVAQNR